jgi:hypothetical protein
VAEMLAAEAVRDSDTRPFWMGRLTMTIAYVLAGKLDRSDLRAEYRAYLRSPACSPELRATLRDVSR